MEKRKEMVENIDSTTIIALTPLANALMNVNEKLAALNVAFTEGKQENVLTALANVSISLTALNDEEKATQFAEILGSDIPVLEAIKRGTTTYTILKAPTTKTPKYTLSANTEIIDLKELSEFNPEIGNNLFANANALLTIEALNRLILAYEVENGDGILAKKWEKFNMTVTAEKLLGVTLREINDGMDFEPIVQKVADMLVDGILIDRKNTGYWVSKYAPYAKSINRVKASKDGAFRKFLMRILNRCITGEAWIIE